MAKYTLTISSWEGIVPGAKHYKGRVTGDYPQSCHGGSTIYHGEDGPLKGKTTCAEDHVLPGRADWEVEASWTEERYERYAAGGFEGDSPAQFTDEDTVLRTAAQRFLGELPGGRWWEEKVPQSRPGDQLFYGCPAMRAEDIEDDGYGGVLAEIPA